MVRRIQCMYVICVYFKVGAIRKRIVLQCHINSLISDCRLEKFKIQIRTRCTVRGMYRLKYYKTKTIERIFSRSTVSYYDRV